MWFCKIIVICYFLRILLSPGIDTSYFSPFFLVRNNKEHFKYEVKVDIKKWINVRDGSERTPTSHVTRWSITRLIVDVSVYSQQLDDTADVTCGFFMMVLQSCILVGARKLAIWICSYQVSRWRQKKREAHAACEQRTYFFFFIIYLFFSLREGWLFFFIVMINGCGGFTQCLVKKMVIICVDY